MVLRVTSAAVHEIRIKFAADRPLTELAAIDLTKQALIQNGKSGPNMRPVPTGHHDALGAEIVFAQNDEAHDGFVLWWIDRPEYTWEYMVRIARDGGEVVCTITKPL
jgi:hypothetical protein